MSYELTCSDRDSNQDSPPKEQERYLPVANITRIMKKSLPRKAKISKEAKECIQECVSEFISFITSEASDRCQQERRKTINGDDLLYAMQALGFDNYLEPLKVYLKKYRESQVSKRNPGKKEYADSLSTSNTSANAIPPSNINSTINNGPLTGSIGMNQHPQLSQPVYPSPISFPSNIAPRLSLNVPSGQPQPMSSGYAGVISVPPYIHSVGATTTLESPSYYAIVPGSGQNTPIHPLVNASSDRLATQGSNNEGRYVALNSTPPGPPLEVVNPSDTAGKE
eukprot:TRINITY_DN9665_c0_g1_i1.p1 TRINITY_DN9665_c0_g1~~TRINITY_DN9665_c0_g1_i1.p1  ORF type:complete len:281 (+),score=37.05 TRINITY_DN9665_c0_g1_i1:75-917(+)